MLTRQQFFVPKTHVTALAILFMAYGMTPHTWHAPIDIVSDQLQSVTGLPRLSFFLIELNFIEAAFGQKFEVDKGNQRLALLISKNTIHFLQTHSGS